MSSHSKSPANLPTESNARNVIVRSAVPGDMPSIVETATAAFTTFDVFGPPWFSDAGILPAILAALPSADPGLSRVAVDAVSLSVVAHAQWTRCTMYLAGKERNAAMLAPLSVHPSRQGKGIGTILMRDGIECLRARDVGILLLLGHETYYPRFGLRGGCMGVHGILVPAPAPLAEDAGGYHLRPFACGDERSCRSLWREAFEGVDGAIDPGPGIIPWMSKTKDIVSCILERDGTAVGHARFDARPGTSPESLVLRFLAVDPAAAKVLLGRIGAWVPSKAGEIRLPMPFLNAARLFRDAKPYHEWWAAGMAMAMDGDAEVESALTAIAAKDAPPLAVEWPPVFDF